MNVLLAEDNQINQRLAAAVLQRRGHRVVVVDNGRKAVEAVGREPFDAVLMDIQMPEMDGLEATAEIRRRERLAGTARRLPIIAVTAHAMPDDRRLCIMIPVGKPGEEGARRAKKPFEERASWNTYAIRR